MKILNRYLLKEFIKPLLLCAAAFGCLVLISEFFRELGTFTENKASFTTIFVYLFLNLPWWTVQALPVAVLLAVLFSLGELARRGEITALKAAGINLWRVIAIFFALGICIGVFEIALRELVIPHSVAKAHELRKARIHKQDLETEVEFKNLVISLPGNGRMTIGYMNAEKNIMKQVIADYYNDNFALVTQVVAPEGTFNGRTWTLNNGLVRSFIDGEMKEDRFDRREFRFPFKPKDFIIERARPEEMTTPRYLKYLGQLKNLGVPAVKDKIEFNVRWSSAFSHVIVMLIGIPFALGFGSRHGKILSFTFALIFAFVYWGVQAVSQSFGENGVISPFLAAWMGNVIFAGAGIYLLSRVEK